MAIHKYIFYVDDRGIRAYRACADCRFEIVRYLGEAICKNSSLEEYFKWFENVASIASDDSVDFCFLSNREMIQPQFEYSAGTSSSWTKDEIRNFCQTMIAEKNYEISLGNEKQFVCQISNIYDSKCVEKLYLKCIPEFLYDESNYQMETTSNNKSILYQYYKDKLDELNKR